MKKVDHKELEKLINLCYKAKQSLFVYGRPGIGKSDKVKKMAKELSGEREFKDWNKLQLEEQKELLENRDKYFVLLDERVSEYSDTSDAKGLPDFVEMSESDEIKGGRPVVWGGQLWVRYFAHPDAHGIIFLDEINNAPPSIQKACYKIVLDRQIGNMSFGEDVSVIGAGNRIQDKSNVFAMPKALDNRGSHVELEVPSADDWVENFAIPNKIHSDVIAFIKSRPDMLHKWSDDREDKAYPSPRSWEMLSNLIHHANDREEEILAANSTVGSGAAVEFSGFLKIKDEIDMETIMENPEKVKDLEDMSTKWAVASYVAEKYKADKDKLGKALEVACNLSPSEFKIQATRFIKNVDEEHFTETIKEKKDKKAVKHWNELAKKVGKYFLHAD